MLIYGSVGFILQNHSNGFVNYLDLTPILAGPCLGLTNDMDCCTASNPCNIGEGDCDKDSECAAGLICGTDNCIDFRSNVHALADCCIKPVPGI